MDQMLKIVNQLMNKPDSVPFRVPVDWRGMGLYDYPQIVKKPMDLSTVKTNLEKGEYKSVSEAAEDVRLIWLNCKRYNQDGSDFYNLAETFSKRFEEKYTKVKEDVADEEADSHPPSHEEKIRFSHNIYKIKQEELGQVVEKLEEKCVEAMDKSTNDDEIEINIDAIDPKTFHELERFVTQCIAQAQPKKSKKKSAASSSDIHHNADSSSNAASNANKQSAPSKKAKTSA